MRDKNEANEVFVGMTKEWILSRQTIVDGKKDLILNEIEQEIKRIEDLGYLVRATETHDPESEYPLKYKIEVVSSVLISTPSPQHGADKYEPAPIRNDLPAVWDLVISDVQVQFQYIQTSKGSFTDRIISDMRKRDLFGRKKHGGPLQPFNGRNPLWDGYQEDLDLIVYLRQAIWEAIQKNSVPSVALMKAYQNALLLAFELREFIGEGDGPEN